MNVSAFRKAPAYWRHLSTSTTPSLEATLFSRLVSPKTNFKGYFRAQECSLISGRATTYHYCLPIQLRPHHFTSLPNPMSSQRWDCTGTLMIQRDYYNDELSCLTKDGNLPATSSIRHFRPFIGNDGILRIGGRLQNAFLSEDEKQGASQCTPPTPH